MVLLACPSEEFRSLDLEKFQLWTHPPTDLAKLTHRDIASIGDCLFSIRSRRSMFENPVSGDRFSKAHFYAKSTKSTVLT